MKVYSQDEGKVVQHNQRLNELEQKMDMHGSILDGLSENVRAVALSQKKLQDDLSVEGEKMKSIAVQLKDQERQLIKLANQLQQFQTSVDKLNQEQDLLREDVQSSVAKVNASRVLAIIAGVLAIVLSWILARMTIKKNRINWYSLVRDTLRS
jgi:chromosome segregation ATPase